jgi:hydroxyquinol 1,2-dioxygenase
MRMREFDEATITEAVLERVANTPDLRVRRVSQALVKHLAAAFSGCE